MDSLNAVMGAWVHNLKPEIIEFTDKFALRWYGLAYLAGFVAGYYGLRWLAKRDLWVVKPDKVADFIAYAALFGVFLGGRLGYVLFYMIPEKGIGHVLADPLIVLRVWEGGMASHGGILGLTIFTFFYARKCSHSWPGVGDGLVIVAPLGIFFGRVANFINGELYGRATEVSVGMKFPKELLERENEESFRQAMEGAVAADPERLRAPWESSIDNGQMLEAAMDASRDNPAVLEAIAQYVTVRHPSQIYQALLEGLALFLILFITRIKFRNLGHGVITGLFFVLYATFRIVAEQFREPDSAWVIENVLTKGQFYSIFMFAIGAAFLWVGLRGKAGRLGDAT